jgi:hypothetical protein
LLGIRIDVEVVPRGSLPRAEFKADRLKDLRPAPSVAREARPVH